MWMTTNYSLETNWAVVNMLDGIHQTDHCTVWWPFASIRWHVVVGSCYDLSTSRLQCYINVFLTLKNPVLHLFICIKKWQFYGLGHLFQTVKKTHVGVNCLDFWYVCHRCSMALGHIPVEVSWKCKPSTQSGRTNLEFEVVWYGSISKRNVRVIVLASKTCMQHSLNDLGHWIW